MSSILNSNARKIFYGRGISQTENLSDTAFANFNKYIQVIQYTYGNLYLASMKEEQTSFTNDVQLASDFIDIVASHWLGYTTCTYNDYEKLVAILEFMSTMHYEINEHVDTYGWSEILERVLNDLIDKFLETFDIHFSI